MKLNHLLFFILFSSLSVSAQEVISTQGGSYTNSSANIDFTIGEVIINTGTDGTNDITQGFHQSNWNIVGTEDNAPEYEASVYPNPAEEVLIIQTSDFEQLTYLFYDAHGKLVMSGELSTEQTPIQVNLLAPGSYSLTLNKGTQPQKTFHLIKTH